MNITKAVREAREMLTAHGLDSRGWTVELNHGRREAGHCDYANRTIRLSRYLTALHTEEQVRDTIAHEVAHALTPGHSHDAVWATMCRRLGGNGKRTHNNATVPARWEGTCPRGHKTHCHRLTKRAQAACCARCTKVYDTRYLFSWVDRGAVRL